MPVPAPSGDCDVLLVGFESQENLGLRSLAAYLERAGLRVGIQPMQGVPPENILRRALAEKARIVGFSLIFQRMLDAFTELIAYLRQNGVGGHFTMGGHFPSFEFAELLATVPGLDSIVRHEGEETLCELARRLDQPDAWADIPGLAYRLGGTVHVNPPRPLIADLDSLPFPRRDAASIEHRGIGIRSITGSRGCHYGCSFCSISEFYRVPPGPIRRARSPRNVVEELCVLYEQHGARIFIFQDDDLLMCRPVHRLWLDAFLDELQTARLADKILWRISCRVDDLDPGCIQRMRQCGLASIYLGIESACDAELEALHKGYRVAAVYRAVDLLRELETPFEFGFMLFTPDSTLDTVKENLRFLEYVSPAGDTLVHFCKLSPYAGTPVRRRLQNEGRLEGALACPDYRFLDPRLELLQLFCATTFGHRNFDDTGLVEQLRFAKFDAAVLRRFGSGRADIDRYEASIRSLTRACNESVLDSLGFAVEFIERNPLEQVTRYWEVLERVRQHELSTQRRLEQSLETILGEVGFLNPVS